MPTNGSTKKTTPAKGSKMPTKHSSPQESGKPINGNTKKTLPAKGTKMHTKHSSPQGSRAPNNPYISSPKNGNNGSLKNGKIGSPKNGNKGNKAKDLHKILILLKADGMPFGWALIGFYDVKEWLKSICNRDGSCTTLGTKTFQPFTNLFI
jgi:hypothetical protein